MAETASAIILSSLRSLGVKEAGESLGASEGADALIYMNDILDGWSLEPLMQTNTVQLSQTLVASQATYTFGSGGDNSTRPVRIEKAWIRDSSNIDIPIRLCGMDEYNEKVYKTSETSYPYLLYYRAEYPLGVVNLYPEPSTTYTLYLEALATISSIATLATSVDLAPGYIKALKRILAVEISPEYKIDPMILGEVKEKARESKAWIKRINRQQKKTMANPIRRAVGRSRFYGRLFSG